MTEVNTITSGDYALLNSSEALWIRVSNQTLVDTAPAYKVFIGKHVKELIKNMKKRHSVIKIYEY